MATIGTLVVDLKANTAQFNEGMKRAGGRIQQLGKRFQSVGRDLSLKVTAPILAFGVLTLKSAADFEAGMNKVKALTGASGDELKALEKQAKTLGRTTQFSASQAADAMGFLGMAGFQANEILGAMPGTLELAASAQLDLGSSADIVSNILTGYGLKVEDLTRVNDVLVKSFTSANTDLVQLGQAMKFAGPVASGVGLKFEETAAALGLMGNAGFQAGLAGTALRGAIVKMLNPTGEAGAVIDKLGLSFVDSTGKLRPLVEIIKQLEEKGVSTAEIMKLFGQRAGPAMQALVSQGSDALEAFTATLEKSGGTASKIAAVQMEGLAGGMRALRSAFEGFMLAIAQSGLLEWATQFAKKMTGIVQRLAETNPAFLKWGTVIALAAAAVGPLLVVMGSLMVVIGALASPIGLVLAAVAGLGVAWGLFGKQAVEAVKKVFNAVKTWLVDRFGALVRRIKSLIKSIGGAFRNIWRGAPGGRSFGPVPALQHGAVLTRPTVALVGEAGRELVVPAQRSQRGPEVQAEFERLMAAEGGGETTIIVPVIVDGRELARVVARHTKRGVR